jgi:hypothetical protein
LQTASQFQKHIDQVFIDDSFGQTIDADYPSRDKRLSLKFGVKIVDEIVEDIIRTGDASLFMLFSVFRGMSGASAKEVSSLLKRIEGMLRDDGEAHDATMIFDDVALTFIVADDATAARLRFEGLRRKRDRESRYAQEYMLTLSPRVRGAARTRRTRDSNHHFAIRAIAIKQNRANYDGILAFSPRIPESGWQIRESYD